MTEILAPAGSKEMLTAALRAGASAVYFGASDFNARRNAANFSTDDIASVVSYCHIRGVRAYLALNTLISDEEMKRALDVAAVAAECGIDGVIIADLGLARLLHKASPKLPLHASTQIGVHNSDGVEYMRSLGFKRVVLARENSYAEIKQIAEYAKKAEIELEVFVHGAQCMSVSGQCLFSAALGSRSGNRGLCAGTCRLPFCVKDGTGFDLSLKDMCLYRELDRLVKLGVASLKIEGRMKRPEYVAMAVDAARAALSEDNTINKSELDEKLLKLQNVFSRSGFTDGYFNNRIDKEMFGVRSEQDISNTKQALAAVHDIYRREFPRVGVDMSVRVHPDEPVTLTVSDGINSVECRSVVPQPAENKPCDYDSLQNKLSKCGSTPYYLRSLNTDILGKLFVPSRVLSRLRDEALEQLTNKRAVCVPIDFEYPVIRRNPPGSTRKMKIFVSVHTLEQLPDKSRADMFFIPLESDDRKVKALVDGGYSLAVKTPPYFFSVQDKIERRLKAMKQAGVNYAVAENVGAVNWIKSAEMKVIGGAGLNIYNSQSADNPDFEKIILSYELAYNMINSLSCAAEKGVTVYGKMPLMLLRNCPVKAFGKCTKSEANGCTIIDRKGVNFDLLCEDGATRLYNSVPTYLLDKLNLLETVDFAVLNFTSESKATVELLLDSFSSESESLQAYTRGLFFKGVL